MMRNALTADQVAARLGVKLATVYAYVSRGVLTRTIAGDGRTSQFDAAEVDRIARRGRPRKDSRQIGRVDVSLATAITWISGERLLYRGHDATRLAESASFETVAELLWTGELKERPPWPRVRTNEALATAIVHALPPASPAIERFVATAAALACAHPLRLDLRASAVIGHARELLTTLVHVLPRVGAREKKKHDSGPQRLCAQLWPRLSPLAATPARLALLDAALILLADHELATSTLAARVAASTRADPFAVVLAALGAVSGPLHGKAALFAHELLLDAERAPAPELAVARVLGTTGRIPGFGHPVYRESDPRARLLLKLLAPLVNAETRARIDAVSAAASASSSHSPNVDFALAALAFANRMPVGATEAIFALARISGWIAHALEEYGEQPLRFRARAIYVGPTGSHAKP